MVMMVYNLLGSRSSVSQVLCVSEAKVTLYPILKALLQVVSTHTSVWIPASIKCSIPCFFSSSSKVVLKNESGVVFWIMISWLLGLISGWISQPFVLYSNGCPAMHYAVYRKLMS